MDFLSSAEAELNKLDVVYEAREKVDGFPNLYGDNDFVLTHKRGLEFNFPWLKFAKDWHSDEEYSELKKENELLKSKIKNIIQNNTFQCDFVYDDDNELYMSLYENMYKELEKLLKEK